MTDQHDTTNGNNKSTFVMSSCMEMMGKMFSQEGCNCDCEGMVSEANLEGGNPEEWRSMMSQMMGTCFGEQVTSEEASEEMVDEA